MIKSKGRSESADAPTVISMQFASSQPPARSGELTLARLLRLVTHCEHPKDGQSPATVVERDGSRIAIRWCGACGAVDLNARGFGDWIRPGVVQLLGDGDRLVDFARDLKTRIDKLAELVNGARAACEASDPPCAGVPPTTLQLEVACEELRSFVRAALGEGPDGYRKPKSALQT